MTRSTARVPEGALSLERGLVVGLALITVGASVIHLGATGQHLDEPLIGEAFLVMAFLQFAWAGALLTRSSRNLLVTGLAGNGAIIGLWVVTRVTAIPFVPGLERTEPVGVADTISTMLELVVLTVGGLCLLLPPKALDVSLQQGQHVLSWLAAGVAVLVAPALIAPHHHESVHMDSFALASNRSPAPHDHSLKFFILANGAVLALIVASVAARGLSQRRRREQDRPSHPSISRRRPART